MYRRRDDDMTRMGMAAGCGKEAEMEREMRKMK